MKKFIAISSAILVAIVAVFITLGCIKPENGIDCGAPNRVYLYAKSATAIKNGNKSDGETYGFSSASVTYEEVTKLVNEMFSISMLEYAFHGDSTKPVVGQDIANKYAKYSSSLIENKAYAVRYTFTEKQSQVVSYQGDTKVVEYYAIMMIINPDKNYQEIPVYFSTTSGSSSYAEKPMLVNAKTDKLVEYIKNCAA